MTFPFSRMPGIATTPVKQRTLPRARPRVVNKPRLGEAFCIPVPKPISNYVQRAGVLVSWMIFLAWYYSYKLHSASFLLDWIAMAGVILYHNYPGTRELIYIIWNHRIDTKIEGDDFQIKIRKYRKGSMLSESIFPREKLCGVFAYDRERFWGRMMKSVALNVGNRPEVLVHMLDDAKADALVAEIRRHAFAEDAGA